MPLVNLNMFVYLYFFVNYLIFGYSCHVTFNSVFRPDPIRIKNVRHRAGSEIILNCKESKSQLDIKWYFKACAVDYKEIDCELENVDIDDQRIWKELQSERGKTIMKIQHFKLENSGIYRCLVNNMVKKIYVIEIDSNDWPPPKVISVVPNNVTVKPSSYLAIICNVNSKTPPTILWFKECRSELCEIAIYTQDIHLSDDNNCLCLVRNNSTSSMKNGPNIYLSKLLLHNVHSWDNGTYICSALSSEGKDYKKTHVHVVGGVAIRRDGITYTSYLFLLLIPLIAILAACIIFRIFCCAKSKNKENLDKDVVRPFHPNTIPIRRTT